jgi:LuxR family maltose regulon positive regulatory protein
MIISTKLHPPRTRSSLIPRPRLAKRLAGGLNCELTLVTAPPGYGKTALLSQWAAGAAERIAWISLDARDNDPMRFWMHNFTALEQAVLAFDVMNAMDLTGDPSGDSLLAMLINGLNRLAEPVIFIWDDFHYIENRSILLGVSYLVDRLPPHVHIFMTCRTTPSLPLSRWRAQEKLNELDVSDLRFTLDEAEQFFRLSGGLSLSPEQCAAVLDRTEGWIAGMRLAAMSLSRADDPAAAIQNITGRRRDFAGYFFEEVLSAQPRERAQFLLNTSILQRMNAGLCEAVTGLADCAGLLRELEQANPFLVPLDEEGYWYRYHHLFQQFLHMQLETRHPESVGSLHAAAGRWLREHGFREEAVAHFLASAHYETAMELIEEISPQLMKSRWGTLHQWLDELPVEMLFQRPGLFMMYLASLYLSGRVGQATDMYWWAASRLENEKDSLSRETLQYYKAGLNFLIAARSFLERDFESSVEYWEKYTASDPEGGFITGFGMDSNGYHPMWDISVVSAGLARAQRILHKLLQIWSGKQNIPLVIHFMIEYGKLLYEWNRLEEAETCMQEAWKLGKEQEISALAFTASLWLSRIYTAMGRHYLADYYLQAAEEWRKGSPSLSARLEWYRALYHRMRGNSQEATAWLERCGLRPEDEIPRAMLDEYDLFACLLAEQGRENEALTLTERLLDLARRDQLQNVMIRLTLHKSLLLQRRGLLTSSLDALEESLSLAESEGYIRTFAEEGEPAVRLLTAYLHSRQHKHRRSVKPVTLAYVKKLLQQMADERNGRKDSAENWGAEKLQVPQLTPQEMAVLRWIAAGYSNKAIAEELNISLSTVKTHIRNLYSKLGAGNRVQAIQRAKQRGDL